MLVNGAKVLVGQLTGRGSAMIERYIEKFLPGANIEPLTGSGVKAKLKINGSKPETMLIILDDYTWGQVSTSCADILRMNKCHKYVDDNELRNFLEGYLGHLDGEEQTVGQSDAQLFGGSSDSALSSSKDDLIRIAELEKKLSNSEMLVRNLQEQLQSASEDNDISEFVKRIKQLEGELEQKESELKASASKTSGSMADLIHFQSECERLTKEKDKLSAENTSLTEKVSSLNENLSSYRTRYDDAIAKMEDLQANIATLEAQASDDSLLEEKVAELSKVQEQVSALKRQLNDKEMELSWVRAELETSNRKVEDYKSSVAKLNESIADKEAIIANTNTSLESLKAEYTTITENLEASRKSIEELQEKSKSLQDTINEKSAQIAQLKEEKTKGEEQLALMQQTAVNADEKEAQLQELYSELANKKAELSRLNDDLLVKQTELDTLRSLQGATDERIKELEEENARLSSEKSNIASELSSIKVERDDLAVKFSTSDAERESLSTVVDALTEQVAQLESKNSILETSINDLNTQLESNTASENELLDERRKVLRLETELKTLKEHGFGSRKSASDEEVEELKARITELEANDKTEELQAMQDSYKEMEDELAIVNDELNDLRNNPFSDLYSQANPRAMYNFAVNVPESLNSKFVVFAGGSNESKTDLYQTLLLSVASIQARVVIVDLVSDTDIDRAFGVKGAKSPIGWLAGKDRFANYVTATRFPNVKVISTALAYFNELYLLTVDWSKRLKELDGVADLVIVNVGCLSNVVSKMLYSSFSKLMRGCIVLKATPVNLRTCIISVSGMSLGSDSVVYCVGFDDKDNVSSGFYTKMLEKTNCYKLKPKEPIQLV